MAAVDLTTRACSSRAFAFVSLFRSKFAGSVGRLGSGIPRPGARVAIGWAGVLRIDSTPERAESGLAPPRDGGRGCPRRRCLSRSTPRSTESALARVRGTPVARCSRAEPGRLTVLGRPVPGTDRDRFRIEREMAASTRLVGRFGRTGSRAFVRSNAIDFLGDNLGSACPRNPLGSKLPAAAKVLWSPGSYMGPLPWRPILAALTKPGRSKSSVNCRRPGPAITSPSRVSRVVDQRGRESRLLFAGLARDSAPTGPPPGPAIPRGRRVPIDSTPDSTESALGRPRGWWSGLLPAEASIPFDRCSNGSALLGRAGKLGRTVVPGAGRLGLDMHRARPRGAIGIDPNRAGNAGFYETRGTA